MNVWHAFSNKRIQRYLYFSLFRFSPIRIINVKVTRQVQIKAVYTCIHVCTSYCNIQVTGTYKSSLHMYMYMYKLLLHTSYWYIYTCRILNSFGTKPQNNCHVPWHDLILPVSPFPHLLHPLWRSLLSDHLAIFSYAAGTKIQAHYIFSKNLL